MVTYEYIPTIVVNHLWDAPIRRLNWNHLDYHLLISLAEPARPQVEQWLLDPCWFDDFLDAVLVTHHYSSEHHDPWTGPWLANLYNGVADWQRDLNAVELSESWRPKHGWDHFLEGVPTKTFNWAGLDVSEKVGLDTGPGVTGGFSSAPAGRFFEKALTAVSHTLTEQRQEMLNDAVEKWLSILRLDPQASASGKWFCAWMNTVIPMHMPGASGRSPLRLPDRARPFLRLIHWREEACDQPDYEPVTEGDVWAYFCALQDDGVAPTRNSGFMSCYNYASLVHFWFYGLLHACNRFLSSMRFQRENGKTQKHWWSTWTRQHGQCTASRIGWNVPVADSGMRKICMMLKLRPQYIMEAPKPLCTKRPALYLRK